MTVGASPDGDDVRTYTVRLELVDEPGELLRALEPISANGGNLLSIYHERGSLTPRGRIPVEVDVECPPDRFERIVDALTESDVAVVRAGSDRYDTVLTVLFVGDVIGADLSETLARIEECGGATVDDVAVAARRDSEAAASARLRLAVQTERVDETLTAVRELADEKELRVVEPLTTGGESA